MTNTTTTTATTTTTTTTATTNNYDNNNNRKKNPCTYRLPDERALPYCSTHSPVQRGWEGRRPARNRGGVPWVGTVSTRRPCIVVSRRCNAGGERSHQSERHLRPSRERHDTRRKGIEEGGGRRPRNVYLIKHFPEKACLRARYLTPSRFSICAERVRGLALKLSLRRRELFISMSHRAFTVRATALRLFRVAGLL